MKKILVFIFALNISAVFAQRYFDERYISGQAFLNPVLINPGAIGSSGDKNLLVNYRNTWATFSGSPKTVTLNYEGPLTNRLGIGLLVLQDNYGALRTSKGQLGFSYTIKSSSNQIGFGLSAEYIQHGLNNYQVSNTLTENADYLINLRRAGHEYIDATFGVFGIYNDQFIYGLSLPSLISSQIDNSSDKIEKDLGFVLNFGYKAMSKTTGISITPSVLIKKLNNVPTHLDLNLKAGFLDEKLLGGLTYRVGAEKYLGFLLGLNVERLGFYYSYNVSSLAFQDSNNGAHELSLKLTIGKSKDMSEQNQELDMK